VGWKSFNLGSEIDVEGVNVSLLGRYSLANKLSIYGTGARFDSVNDSSSSRSVSGYRFETGVKYQATNRFSFSAGLRLQDMQDSANDVSNNSSSFLIGTHLSF